MSKISDDQLAELLEFAEYKKGELVSDGFPVGSENYADMATALTEIQSLRAENERLRKELEESAFEIKRRDLSFDLRWKSDMRAIERWQSATGRNMTLPDHTDLSVWLFAQLEAAEAKLEEAAKVLEPIVVITDAVLSEAPADATKAKLWNGADNIPLFISLDACRAAKSFLANLKGAE